MSPQDRHVARHLRRSSVVWALIWALLLPLPAAVHARSAESLDQGSERWPSRSAEAVAAPERIGHLAVLTEVGAPGPGGVTGTLVVLILLVASANVAGMLLARTRRFRRPPAAPPSFSHRP